ncbi:LysR family transcriptional regulator [Pendulispora rubella]|uniref:LysR family transcriptional regulator n=1 Tax=Pendulispora rubella TaxID=2741070 RepID=A0ABZ2KZ97_9BACT
MDLTGIMVFVRVVQAGSIRGAAAILGMPKSTVSRKVAELEERLEARLLQRTTRKLGLTDVGRIYYDHCVRIVSDLEDAEQAVRRQQATPRGLLRVTAPANATFLAPIVSDYLKRYPKVRLELNSTARMVDLIEERYDLGIRTGPLPDSSLIARSLGSVTWTVVATPAYLKKHGRPRSPDDLKDHECLLFGGLPGLRLQSGRHGVREIVVPARLVVTEMKVLYHATISGLGIALLPAFLCVDDLRAKRLARVLPDWAPPSTPVHIVYPSTRHLSPTLTSFIEHLQEQLTPAPWGFTPPAEAL